MPASSEKCTYFSKKYAYGTVLHEHYLFFQMFAFQRQIQLLIVFETILVGAIKTFL